MRMDTWKQLLLVTGATILFLLYSPTLLDFRPTSYSIPFPPLRGALEINDKLSATEHLFQDSILGPESIVFHEGDLFTGTEDGRIVKIRDNKIVTVAQTGRDCNLPYEERLCGRPLGLRMAKDGLLYIIDAYYGLHSMNTSTGILTRLLSSNIPIEGQKINFPDDIDIDDRGNVYMTDASAKWDLSTIYYLMTEYEGSGRVIKFNIYSGKAEVIIRDLYFPNGIQLTHDGKSLLICEISRRRILRYYLEGAKKGKLEVFVDQLPAEPDNIRLSSGGGYWVAFTSARNSTHRLLLDNLNQFPLIKRIWGRAQHGFGSLLMGLAEIVPSHTFKEFAYRVKRGDVVLSILPRHGIILELDEQGKIIRSFQAPDGSTSDLSQVTEHNGYLYLGSFINRYLGRLKL